MTWKQLCGLLAALAVVAACGSTKTAPPKPPTTPAAVVPVLTADPAARGAFYLGLVTQEQGEATPVDAAKRVCTQDQPQLAAQITRIPSPDSWTAPVIGGTEVLVDLHGPGPVTADQPGQQYQVNVGMHGGIFTRLSDNEGLCTVMVPAG